MKSRIGEARRDLPLVASPVDNRTEYAPDDDWTVSPVHSHGDDHADQPVAPSVNDTGHAQTDGDLIKIVASLLKAARGEAFLRALGEKRGCSDALGPVMRQLEMDLRARGNETAAFERFADALDDPGLDSNDLGEAVPVLAALTARTIARGMVRNDAALTADVRRQLTLAAIEATRTVVRGRRQVGLEPLPLLARYVGRRALRIGTPPEAVAKALPRIAARLSGEPHLLRRLRRAEASRPDEIWEETRGRSFHPPDKAPWRSGFLRADPRRAVPRVHTDRRRP